MAKNKRDILCILTIISYISTFVSCNHNITSPIISNWGVWGNFETCPNGTFVKGFQLQTQSWKGPILDDTCLNSVKLFCGDPLDDFTVALTSSIGEWGTWGNLYTCGSGYVNGFQLRVERPSVLIVDETATNNVRIFCSNGQPGQYIEGDGERFGVWSDERICGENEAICGLQTQVQPKQGLLRDNTSLNNILMQCCNLQSSFGTKEVLQKN